MTQHTPEIMPVTINTASTVPVTQLSIEKIINEVSDLKTPISKDRLKSLLMAIEDRCKNNFQKERENIEGLRKKINEVHDKQEKNQLIYLIALSHSRLAALLALAGFYRPNDKSFDYLGYYKVAGQHFLVAAKLFKNVPKNLYSQEDTRSSLESAYQRLIIADVLKFLDNANQSAAKNCLLYQPFWYIKELAKFVNSTDFKLQAEPAQQLKKLLENICSRMDFNEIYLNKNEIFTSLGKDAEITLSAFFSPIKFWVEKLNPNEMLLPENFNKSIQFETKKAIPIYILRMAKACREQINLGFSLSEIQDILSAALWAHRKTYNLTALNHKNLQEHLLDAVTLLKENFLMSRRITHEQKLKRISSCLTKVINNYLSRQKTIYDLILSKQNKPYPTILIANTLPNSKALEYFKNTFIFIMDKKNSPRSNCYYIEASDSKDNPVQAQRLVRTSEDRKEFNQLLSQPTLFTDEENVKPAPLKPLTAAKEFHEFLTFTTKRKPKNIPSVHLGRYDHDLRQTLVEKLMWHMRYMSIPQKKLKSKCASFVTKIIHKLDQCSWVPDYGRFFSPTKISGLELVYNKWADPNQTRLTKNRIFPNSQKILDEFIFSDININFGKSTKLQFKNFMRASILKEQKERKESKKNANNSVGLRPR